mgnify:CR=1 FL=1
MIYQIIYTSKLRPGMGEKTVKKIAVQSRERNLEYGITGVLMFANGMALQVIEGEQDAVEALWRQITRDTRHREVMMLVDHHAEKRAFEGMPLALKIITSPKSSAMMKSLAKSAEALSMAG